MSSSCSEPCLCGDPHCGRCFPQPFRTNFKVKTIKRDKGRRKRAEGKRAKLVRADCVTRDGYCRVRRDIKDQHGDCEGPSEWCHLGEKTRAKTRRMAPEERHSTEWTIMACKKHHDMIDGRRKPVLKVAMPDPEGADGLLSWSADRSS